MTIAKEISLRDFEFWGGAISRASLFTYEELDMIEEMMISDFDIEGITETEVNDLFWFDIETSWEMYSEVIGYNGTFDDFYNERSNN